LAIDPIDYSDPGVPTLLKVVVIRFKPWKTVKTFDEEFPVNADGYGYGYVTFVASSLKDRPRFATRELAPFAFPSKG